MAEHKVKITAKDADEFKRIEGALKKLPETVYEDIDIAEITISGLTCKIKPRFAAKQKIVLPSPIIKIVNLNNEIYIYHKEYTFVLTEELLKSDKMIDYHFIPEKELEKSE